VILVDVYVLVHAHREVAPRHAAVRGWLEDLVYSDRALAVSDWVLSGFSPVVTHPRVFTPPTPLERALEFVEALRAQPNGIVVSAGDRQWSIFTRLCRAGEARGNWVPDA
jgi:toxin-antitoxin system PIN domain toxin